MAIINQQAKIEEFLIYSFAKVNTGNIDNTDLSRQLIACIIQEMDRSKG